MPLCLSSLRISYIDKPNKHIGRPIIRNLIPTAGKSINFAHEYEKTLTKKCNYVQYYITIYIYDNISIYVSYAITTNIVYVILFSMKVRCTLVTFI